MMQKKNIQAGKKNDLAYKRFIHAANTFVERYNIDEENKLPLSLIINYFEGNREAVEAEGLSMSRGLLIMGNVGSGKSLIMRIINRMYGNIFPITRCAVITREFAQNGYEAFKKYEYGSRCFDDLGPEKSVRHYGEEVNVMAELLLDRYEAFRLGHLTHITTNLIGEEIESRYGDRILSRLREMCNVVVLGEGKNSTDRRVDSKPIINRHNDLQPTEKEKEKMLKDGLNIHFQRYRETGDWKNNIFSYMYDIFESYGSINYPEARFNALKRLAKRYLRYEAKKKKQEERGKIMEVVKEIDFLADNDRVTTYARIFGVKKYFDNLIDMEMSLFD